MKIEKALARLLRELIKAQVRGEVPDYVGGLSEAKRLAILVLRTHRKEVRS